jgi:hypothetical protein
MIEVEKESVDQAYLPLPEDAEVTFEFRGTVNRTIMISGTTVRMRW